MRTLSTNTDAAVALPVTTPGYLIQFAWDTPEYYSTRSTVTWNSKTWTATNVRVDGLGASSQTAGGATLTFGNADLAIGTLILSDGASGRAVSVWKFYGDSALSLTDPVALFSGVADEATIDDNGRATIRLVQAESTTLYCPRSFMTQAAGFNFLPADGQIVDWNDEIVRLTPEGL